MNTRVGVIGIGLEALERSYGLDALSKSGNNFGNMLFTNAAYSQVPNTEHIGFEFDCNEVKKEFDALIIPAANWINLQQDWGWLANRLSETGLPLAVMGLGAQLTSLGEAKDVPEGTKKLMKVFSEMSSSIAVRGEFTKEVLATLGIDNSEAIGCPSIFHYGVAPEIDMQLLENPRRVAIGPTRYGLSRGHSDDKQRTLYQHAIRNAHSIFFQSEAYEISVLNKENVASEDSLAAEYYGMSASDLHDNLYRQGRYHTSLHHWVLDLKREDIFVGTRIHGVVAATLAGVPAVLIAHDNRTRELAETMAVPSIPIEDFDIAMLYDLNKFLKDFDFEKFVRRARFNLTKLARFYKSNGLESRCEINT